MFIWPWWPWVPNHPYRILTVGASGSVKTNAHHQEKDDDDIIDKIVLYAKIPSEPKYQLLIKKREEHNALLYNKDSEQTKALANCC